MKYKKEERLEIGRRIYEGELTRAMAANQYDINEYTARDYMRAYKASINVDIPKQHKKKITSETLGKDEATLNQLNQMSKEELIDEVIRARINEERAKKGYIVKGDGANKEYIPLSKKSTK